MKRRLIAAGSIAAVLFAGLFVGVPAASASSTASVIFDDVTDGQTVDGDVVVTLTATPSPGEKLTRVSLLTRRVEPADYHYQYMSLAGCDTTLSCTGTITIHTQDLANGPNSLQADVGDSTGGIRPYVISIVVDNPKPTVAITSPIANQRVWGSTDIQVAAAAADRADAQPVARVEYYFGFSVTPLRQTNGSVTWGNGLLGVATVAPFDLNISFGGMPRAGYLIAVAYDTAGNHTTTAVSVVVHPGLNLSIAPWPAYPNQKVIGTGTGQQALLNITEPAGANPNAPNSLSFYLVNYTFAVDGQTVLSRSYPDDSCPSCPMTDHIYPWDSDQSFTVAGTGQHSLTLTATDNWGVTSKLSTQVDTDLGITAAPITWSETSTTTGSTLSDGSKIRLTASPGYFHIPVTAITPTSWIESDEIDIDGTPVSTTDGCLALSYTNCPRSTTLVRAWKPSLGTHTLRATIKTPDTSTVLTRTFTVLAGSAQSISASATTVKAATKITIYDHLYRFDNGQALSGTTVALQWQAAGSITWTTVTTRTTDTAGKASASVTPSGNGHYRWHYSGTTSVISSYSSSIAVNVKTSVSIKLSATTIKYGTTLKVTTAESPIESAVSLTLQRYVDGTGWVTIATTHESTTGTGSFSVKLPKVYTQQLRVVKSATTKYTTSYSSTAIVTVI